MGTMKTRTKRTGIATLALAGALAGGPAIGGASAHLAAQQTRDGGAIAERATSCAWSWRSLGIGALRCSACEMTFDDGELVEARFGAEPEVTSVDEPRVARGDAVRRGDRLVAVDGGLITTREGADNLRRVRPGRAVTLTVRRDGETRDLRVVPGDACDAWDLPVAPAVPAAPVMPAPAIPAPPTRATPPASRSGTSPAMPVEPATPPAGVAPAVPAAIAEPLPPLPPSALPPDAHLGFGFRCFDCGIRDGRWSFSSALLVTGVERDGPAWAAGIRVGDEIVALDEIVITTEAAGRRFTDIRPGDRVRWRVRRDGESRVLTMTAEERVKSPLPAEGPRGAGGPALASVGRPFPDALRYQGRIGETDVEVRGAPVTVTVDEDTGEILIRTSDTVVRLRRTGGGGEAPR